MKNGEIWLDDNQKPIQAHGGMILLHKGVYYWYGEHKGRDNTVVNGAQLARVDVIGISCYSSKDMRSWHYEGLALPAVPDDKNSILHPSRVVERPKVLYNARTGKFVMWFHSDDFSYHTAELGVAVADSPEGPFELINHMRPNGMDSRDMTAYKDDDDIAYVFHSSDWNRTMVISRLNPDYTGFDGAYTRIMVDQSREAPAILKRDGEYYCVTSGCTGWAPNCALYAKANHIMGHWRLIDNPCEGPNARMTFFGQSTYVIYVNGQPHLMLDHWKPENLQASGYSVLPITFDDIGMRVKWTDEFNGI